VYQAANLSLWAESVWFPAILIADPRCAGNPLTTSRRCWQFPSEALRSASWFASTPARDCHTLLESMRYKAADSQSKNLVA
jgi:hypothetical protein